MEHFVDALVGKEELFINQKLESTNHYDFSTTYHGKDKVKKSFDQVLKQKQSPQLPANMLPRMTENFFLPLTILNHPLTILEDLDHHVMREEQEVGILRWNVSKESWNTFLKKLAKLIGIEKDDLQEHLPVEHQIYEDFSLTEMINHLLHSLQQEEEKNEVALNTFLAVKNFVEVIEQLNNVRYLPETEEFQSKVLHLFKHEHILNETLPKAIKQSFLLNESMTKGEKIWNELLHAYKQETPSIHRDSSHYEVEGKDVKGNQRWLKNILQTIETREGRKQFNPSLNLLTHRPVSNISSYLIHVHDHVEGVSIDRQFLHQFQQVMRMSQFLNRPHGNHLTVTLQPEYLGEMSIHLTEIDGELTLKMIVSSQVTKRMLEANIQELRNIFSPHQITIEEQELQSQEVQQHQEEFSEPNEENASHDHEEDSQQTTKNDFQEEINKLLMNEKV